ncbi:PaaI family thioesterase [Flammeovirgaceae bacterium SG7u.111]|nr:PaaI family thioesterase [Flammeovirgaceae bacterium SG7u.132]WPO37540.1 PaaI family thioesterase [Flammeovirgaceae bacterium SG7u.111]
MKKEFFQDYMQDNICFGCGNENPDGLQIKSYWEGEESVCKWKAEKKHQGWKNLLNGGVIGTLIDCHCMGTAMAAAYRAENRGLDSSPFYRYATGTLNVRYLKPTPNYSQIELRAKVIEIKKKKTVLSCELFADGELTAQAEVVALRVFDSSEDNTNNPFA